MHIFENVMLHSVRVQNPKVNLIFQQHNHPVRCSMGIQRWFTRRPEIELIPWPPKSPDFNVVEHMWAKLKEGRILRYGNIPPRNPQQLWDQVMEIWDNLAQDRDYCLTKTMFVYISLFGRYVVCMECVLKKRQTSFKYTPSDETNGL